MLKLILIRHGETQGNKLKRYIGKRTDEPLCPEAGNMLAQLAYPEVQAVYASPYDPLYPDSRNPFFPEKS